VRRQFLAKKQKSAKTRRTSGFQNLLWTCKITEINTICSQIKQDNDIHHLHKEGFDNLLAGFNEFIRLEDNVTYDDEFGYFEIYSSVAVGSTDIIRTAKSFYGNEWFSNVSIFSEDSIWYGKVSINYCFFFIINNYILF
jgi:hypothetical protein